MHQEAISSAVEADDRIDRAIMDLLLIDSPGPWSVDEVAREVGDDIDTADGLARLARAGLIHRRLAEVLDAAREGLRQRVAS